MQYILSSDYEIIKDIAKRIKKKRISLNYSQEYMAKKTGLSMHTISNIENGKTYTIDNLIKVMRVLGMISNLETLISDVVLDPESSKYPADKQRVKTSMQDSDKKWSWNK